MDLAAYALVGVALGFAFSMGAHYTGACMGMPYASGAIRPGRALALMAPFTLLGAYLASGGVEGTVGHGLLGGGPVSLGLALGILVSAFLLTTLYNVVTIPTSTIQILVFSVVGAGIAAGIPVAWGTIAILVVLWALAPFAAFLIAYVAVRVLDRHDPPAPRPQGLGPSVAAALIAVGTAASFAMGANDVANASGAFIMTGLFGPMTAGLIGGIGLSLGVVTWGRPLLERVAFDLVALDGRMATAAQFAQSSVILAFVGFGYFTSMNQALVGAMIGTGVARGQRRLQWPAIRGVLLGWGVGPASGAALGFVITLALARLGGL
ncbi:MAG TPA: inorganic phosphate transporter [Thermoplasmata archaeon]|nr:inorganic phosphate transporter [Thermoplasmata archaeon]